MRLTKIAIIVQLVFMSLQPAYSDVLNQREIFDVKIRGVQVGYTGLVAKNDGARYSVAFGIRSTGVFELFKSVEISARANGRVINGQIFPADYIENSKFGKKNHHVRIEYANGVPNLLKKEPPIDESKPLLDPSTQVGTLDPASALYMIFRSSAKNELCDREYYLFDGERRARISLGKPNWNGDKAFCECLFVRVAGYKESEIKERKEFPFSLFFEPVPGNATIYELALLEGESRYGSIRIEKRR